MSQRSNHPHASEIDRIARILMDAWAKAEPNHGVTKYPMSYIATFADMAQAVVEDHRKSLGRLVTIEQIKELKQNQTPVTGNCAYLCSLALGENEHPDVSVDEARAQCAEIILRF